MERLELNSGTIVVTGAGSGIGEQIARLAASRGMHAVLADVAADRAESVAAEIRAQGGAAVAIPTDVADFGSVDRLADAVFADSSDVRVVVNNAGIEAAGLAWEMPPSAWERIIRVNLLGVFHGVRAFVPRLLAQGRRAAIVNVASTAALSSGPPHQSAYNASKHGVQAFTECLHLELLQVGAPISVHVVSPGTVATSLFVEAAASGAEATLRRDFFRAFTAEHGMSAARAAELIFEGLARGEFWIRTHPAMQDDAIARRVRVLTERTPPEPIPTEEYVDLL